MELEQRVDERTEQISSLNRQLEQRIAELETIMQVLPVGVAVSHDPECRIGDRQCRAERVARCCPRRKPIPLCTRRNLPFEVYQQGKRLQRNDLPLDRAAQDRSTDGQCGVGDSTRTLAHRSIY